MSEVTLKWMRSFGVPEKDFQKACVMVSQELLFQDVKNVSVAFRKVAEVLRRESVTSNVCR